MDVSIIIINYNTFKLTCACIESVRKLTQDISYEIILVDNASTEIDAKVFKEKFSGITLIQSPTNVGFAKGNNLGIDRAKGEYILLLNSDTILINNVAGILLTFLQKQTSVAAVTCRLEFEDGVVQHNCQRFPAIRYKLFELLRLQKLLPRHIGGKALYSSFFQYTSVAYPDWIWGTCFMFKKELLQLLPEQKLPYDFFMYGEDVQWCLEFRKLGYRVAFDPTARIVHYMGKSGAAKSDLMHQNMDRLIDCYYNPLHRGCIRLLDRLLI